MEQTLSFRTLGTQIFHPFWWLLRAPEIPPPRTWRTSQQLWMPWTWTLMSALDEGKVAQMECKIGPWSSDLMGPISWDIADICWSKPYNYGIMRLYYVILYPLRSWVRLQAWERMIISTDHRGKRDSGFLESISCHQGNMELHQLKAVKWHC